MAIVEEEEAVPPWDHPDNFLHGLCGRCYLDDDEIVLYKGDREDCFPMVDELIELLCHETLHLVLEHVEGRTASIELDNIEHMGTYLRHHTDGLSRE